MDTSRTTKNFCYLCEKKTYKKNFSKDTSNHKTHFPLESEKVLCETYKCFYEAQTKKLNSNPKSVLEFFCEV